MLKIKSADDLRAKISLHYTRDEIADVISKTALALECCLTIGMPSNTLTYKMIDLGVKPTELGMAMALAMKKTDDKWLSPLDIEIKKLVLQNHSKMLQELEEVL